MPPESHTPIRLIRADAELWQAFGSACDSVGKDRSSVTRDFWRWYARLPGGKRPVQPPRPQDPETGPIVGTADPQTPS